MHNIKALRKDLNNYKKKLKDRNLDFDIERFTKLDEVNRRLINDKELLEQEKKSLSKSKDMKNFEKSKKISDEISSITKKLNESQNNLNKIIYELPNIALDDVPLGKDEKSNKLIKKFGKIKDFSFKIKSHTEIGSKDNNIDFETSIKLSGSRFVVLKNKFALLERALINFMLDTHVNEFKYTEVSPPLIVNEDVMKYLKGEPSTNVDVEVFRNGEKKTLTIERGIIPIQSVSTQFMINEETGFIKIDQFSINTANEFKQAALILLQKGMSKLILDLRNNGGGVLSSAVNIADEFLPGGMTILQTKGSNTKNQNYYSENGGLLENIEVAVLINQYSASASEILAGALQDNDRAMIFGRRSFGKGLVQGDFSLRDQSVLRLTVSRYYTPSGRCIQKPYNGNMKDYYSDSYDRFDNGELFAPDSSIFVDSLKFKTRKGRTVYGGGGIMPDIFIPYDTSDFTEYFSQLRFTTAFQGFCFDYVADKRDKWENMEDYKSDFKPNYALVKQLAKYAEANFDIKTRYTTLLRDQKILSKHMKAEIARQLWLENGYFFVMTDYDNEVGKVLEAWENGPFSFKK